MAYIPITEEQSNPFAPLTSELIKQLRDNPIAIAAGLSGAPRIERPAIGSWYFTTGGVGTYALLGDTVGSRLTEAGTSRPGSDLRYSSASGSSSGTPSGTWRSMGRSSGGTGGGVGLNTTLWLRIS